VKALDAARVPMRKRTRDEQDEVVAIAVKHLKAELAVNFPVTSKHPGTLAAAQEITTKPAKAKAFAATPEVGKAFDRWVAGEPLADLATELGFKLYQNLRHQFIKLAGGMDGFYKLREAGAGGAAGANRKVGVVGQPGSFTALDDSKVSVIDGCPRSGGWRSRNVYLPVNVVVPGQGLTAWLELQYTVHISPEGFEYVEAKARERADLLVRTQVNPLVPFVRLRLLSTSHVAKDASKEEDLITQGNEAKQAKKVARKAQAKKLERMAAT
jgi:hypothetical protein